MNERMFPWTSKGCLLNYRIVSQIKPTGHLVYLIEDQTNGRWAGKVSDKSIAPCFSDFNHRAALATRLSDLLRAGLPEARLVRRDLVGGWDQYSPITAPMDDYVFLTRYAEFLARDYVPQNSVSNIDQMIENITFNLWIGNYDRKDEDYVVSADGVMYPIDYQMYGPGFHGDMSNCMGVCWNAMNLNNEPHTGWCAPPFILHFCLKRGGSTKPLYDMLGRIMELSENDLDEPFKGIVLRSQNDECDITQQVKGFLIERRAQLNLALNAWVSSGFPRL